MKAFRLTYMTLAAAVIFALLLSGCGGGATPESRLTVASSADDTNFTNVIASGYISAGNASVITAPAGVGTATPALWVDNVGTANDALVISKAATPVFKVGNAGAVTFSGNQSLTGGLTVNNWAKVAAPTAIATATPAVVIDNAGVSILLDVRKAATPVFSIGNTGDVTQTGARTATGGDTVNNWAKVAAPTAVATATPAFVIDSAGVSVLLDVRKQATPVFTVGNIGSVSGLSLDTSSFISVGSFLALEAATTIPVSGGTTISPLGSMQPISSTAIVTTSTSTAVANGGRVGDLLILRNINASDVITIDGAGGNVECGGNVALGANDVLTLVWNGTDWTCLSLRDN